MLIYVHIIQGRQDSPKQILTVYARQKDSIESLKKNIIRTINATKNRFNITIND